MSITFEATYENGVLKPLTPVPFKENEKVTVIVDQETAGRVNPVLASYGMMGWKGDAETLDRILREAEETQYE
jgi:predicted DNA-binding antitoxin AbrB/MazE fold protein